MGYFPLPVELVEGRDQSLGAFEREPLLTLIAAVGEALEDLGVDQLGEDPVLLQW